jgi:iron(III) transport system permease protein
MTFRKFSLNTEIILLAITLPLTLAVISPIFHIVLRASQAESFDYLIRTGTLKIIGRSFLLISAVSLTTCIIAVPAAWLTARSDLRGRNIWTILLILPLVMPSYVGAFALISAIGPSGFVQDSLGVTRLPSIYGFWGAWLAISLFSYPYVFISVRAGLRGIDPALEEVSRTLGKSARETFWQVTLPQLRPFILAGGLLVALYTLGEFGAVSVMRYDVFSRAIYFQLSLDRNNAALLSLVMLALTLLILLLAGIVGGQRRYYTRNIQRKATLVPLGKWQIPAQIFCAGLVLFALVIPVGVIAYWLLNGLQQGEEIREVISPLMRTMRVAALTAAVCGLVTLPFAFSQVRYPSRLSQLTATSVYLGYALPGVVVGLALVFFGARYLMELGLDNYRILPLLIFGYMVRFLPEALSPARAGLMQVNPHAEESGLTLGRNRLYVLGTITLPLMRSGWVAGMALVFLTVSKELPMTLMLRPAGFDTLATRIWSATTEAFYARAAAPALILVFMSALSMVFILDDDNELRD